MTLEYLTNLALSIQQNMHLPRVGINNIVEILILAFLMYSIAKSLHGTRAWLLIKGVVILFVVYAIAYLLNFNVIVVIFQNCMLFFGIAVIVIIQPDIRKMIESIGNREINITLKSIFNTIFKKANKKTQVIKRVSDKSVQELVKGCSLMGKAKTGALIVIEEDIPLNDIVDSGITVNADITSQLLINIFEKNTPLHDGAVIIQKDRVSAATCYLPLSNNSKINKDLGTRHRAGIGITEQTDAVVIIVSEETGAISVAKSGNLFHNIDREKLAELLKKAQAPKVIEQKTPHKVKNNLPLKALSLAGAIFIWGTIITSINPVESVTFTNVPITIINEDAITDTGKTYSVISDNKVSVTVKDRRDVLGLINESDIEVTADLSKLSITNSVNLEADVPSLPDCEIYLSNSTMQISIEDVISTEIGITIDSSAIDSTEYYLSNVELYNKNIVITGAKSLIDTIGSVCIKINNNHLSEAYLNNSSMTFTPYVYDKNGSLVDSTKIVVSQPKVEAMLEVFETKTLPIKVNTQINSFILKSMISSISYDPVEVIVAADADTLSSYSSLSIDVPFEISLADIKGNQYIKTIKLSEYLPSELKAIGDETISIRLDFVTFYSKVIGFKNTDVKITNQDESKNYTLQVKEFTASLIGVDTSIAEATLEKLGPYVDASTLKNGENTVKVQFSSFGDYAIGDFTIVVTVTNKG